jgi:hypothetical protein
MLMSLKFYKSDIFVVMGVIQDFYKMFDSLFRTFAKECKFLATNFEKISLC